MNITNLMNSKPARALGRLFGTAAAVFAIGLLNPPAVHLAMAVAPTPVAVDQSPLTVRPTIPPDIVLMLDDSGSMGWNFMPDICYLSGVTCSGGNVSATTRTADGTNAALINAANNGTYYDPTIVYSPPIQANGIAYPNSPGITGAYADGFTNTATTVDITAYAQASTFSSSSSYSYTAAYEKYDNGAGVGTGRSNVAFSTSTTGAVAPQTTNGLSSSACSNLHVVGGVTQPGWVFVSYSGSGAKPCVWNFTPTYYYFEYATNSPSSNTLHFVASAAQTCQAKANCVIDSDTTGAAAPVGTAAGQNIANWFTYYRSRILMAKSGLLKAFDTLDPTFRLGFASIDGNNDGSLPSPNHSYGSYTIAGVQPFGHAADAASQRKNFWGWVVGESSGSGTPLRGALDSVGKYYSDTTASADAWKTMSSDPVPITTPAMGCRQAYTILTTDGFWNDSFTGINNVDNTNGPTVNGPNSATLTYTAAKPYSDSNSNTLADVAMKYWKTDLQPDNNNTTSPTGLLNEVPTSKEDPAFWQHMTTFTMGLGFTPTGITPAGTTVDQIFDWVNGANGQPPIPTLAWPTPASDSINNIADLAHAGVNGHGGFFSATDPSSFASGISSALKRATERVGTGASLAANSTQLQTGTAVFQANYYTAVWKGGLKELAVDPNTGLISSTPSWSAENVLPAAASRTITTYNTSTNTFVAFKNGASAPPGLSSTQLAALDPAAANQMAIVNYIRGDTSHEQVNGGNYRTREWVLGDVVDSQPVYSGAPNANEFTGRAFAGLTYDPNSSSTTPFHDWAIGTINSSGTLVPSAASTRTPLVYVAANDGMLHAFNASTGVEAYAYLPGALMVNATDPYTGLAEPYVNITNPGYGSASTYPHQYYNDGELTVADAFVKLASDTNAAWHTILVGTTGRGPARAVYALDVTNPASITPLWERFASDTNALDSNSGYIGQMVGKPVIAQTGDYGTSPAWSVLIGNGYNSPLGKSALLQFDLATGKLYVHATDSLTSNGLAAPVAWIDYPTSGISDIAYAGDLLGRMWSFPLATVASSSSGNTYTPSPSAAGTSLFTAKNASSTVEPITGGTIAGSNPTDHSVWVFFGTGKYLTQTDISDKTAETWYGLKVQTTSGSGNITTSGRSSLVQRQIIAEQAAGAGGQLGLRAVTAKPATSDMTGKNGWYMDLLQPLPSLASPTAQGERIVLPNQFQGNLLLATTRIPQPSTVVDPCNVSGGGWIMAVDPFTGTNPANAFFDSNNDGLVNSSDTITVNGVQVPAAGVGFSALPNAPIFVGVDMLVSFDNGTTSSLKTTASGSGYSRVGWQEIVVP